MAPVKLPVGYKCRLFGSSRNSLGLREYGCDYNDGRSASSIPPGTPAEGEVNAVATGPSAIHVTVISSDKDKSTPALLNCIEGSTPTLPICIEGDRSMCASSTAPKKRKVESGRCSCSTQIDSSKMFGSEIAMGGAAPRRRRSARGGQLQDLLGDQWKAEVDCPKMGQSREAHGKETGASGSANEGREEGAILLGQE
jgi:hypothetical protein